MMCGRKLRRFSGQLWILDPISELSDLKYGRIRQAIDANLEVTLGRGELLPPETERPELGVNRWSAHGRRFRCDGRKLGGFLPVRLQVHLPLRMAGNGWIMVEGAALRSTLRARFLEDAQKLALRQCPFNDQGAD